MDPEALTTSIIALTDSLAARLPLEAAVESYLAQAAIVGNWARVGAIISGALALVSLVLSLSIAEDGGWIFLIASIVLGIIAWNAGFASHTALANPAYWALQQVLP